MSTPMSVMASDPYANLLRQIIDMRASYERVCGVPPVILWVNGPIRAALEAKGYRLGAEVAGMKIMASPESATDHAICSREVELFAPDKWITKQLQGKPKKRA
jgi:hypothetical protein